MRPEIKLITVDKDKTIYADSVDVSFSRNGEKIMTLDTRPQIVNLHPTIHNPDRIILYHEHSSKGLTIFYYKSSVERVFISRGRNLVLVDRDQIYAIRKAFRRFTSTTRPDISRKPGKPFKEYGPPPERVT